MNHEQHSRQTEREGMDWLYTCLGVAVIVGLVLAATVGHAMVSAGITP